MAANDTAVTLEGVVRSGRRTRGLSIQLPHGYPVAAVAAFLLFLAGLIAVRAELPDGAMRDMHWLIAVAVVPMLPFLFPLATRHLSELRAGPLELAFRDLDPEQIVPGIKEIEDVAVALSGASIADMPSRSADLIERVKEIEAERTEVVRINLGGPRLKLASLYFFAFLLESRTIVRRLVLEDGQGSDRAFIGMCSPRALRRSIERDHPLYRGMRKKTPIIDLDNAGDSFFKAFASETAQPGGEAQHSPPADPARVVQILGPALERSWIDRRELDGLPGLRRILDSERRYIAIVDRAGSYQVLDQYRVSLAIARRATGA
jgi:hypothetical protein